MQVMGERENVMAAVNALTGKEAPDMGTSYIETSYMGI